MTLGLLGVSFWTLIHLSFPFGPTGFCPQTGRHTVLLNIGKNCRPIVFSLTRVAILSYFQKRRLSLGHFFSGITEQSAFLLLFYGREEERPLYMHSIEAPLHKQKLHRAPKIVPLAFSLYVIQLELFPDKEYHYYLRAKKPWDQRWPLFRNKHSTLNRSMRYPIGLEYIYIYIYILVASS